jgi:hypothetical protein
VLFFFNFKFTKTFVILTKIVFDKNFQDTRKKQKQKTNYFWSGEIFYYP